MEILGCTNDGIADGEAHGDDDLSDCGGGVVHDSAVVQVDYVVNGDNVVDVQADYVVHGGGVFQDDHEIHGGDVCGDDVHGDEVVHYDDVLHDGCGGMTGDVVVTADSFAENLGKNHYYILTGWNDVAVYGMFHPKTEHSVDCPHSDMHVSAIQTVFCHFQMLYVAVLIHGSPIKVYVKNGFYVWYQAVPRNFPRDPKSSNPDLQYKEGWI
jgi:hypothetical protein